MAGAGHLGRPGKIAAQAERLTVNTALVLHSIVVGERETNISSGTAWGLAGGWVASRCGSLCCGEFAGKLLRMLAVRAMTLVSGRGAARGRSRRCVNLHPWRGWMAGWLLDGVDV